MADLAVIDQVISKGDLSKLNDGERIAYYNKTCETLGLNPITRPFEYITLQGKMTLYARKDATEQLRNLHKVSLEVMENKVMNGVYVVRARATLPSGRFDEAIGAVPLPQAAGDAYANAIMKAETKAKRRVTLSIVGLGMLDESELETIAETKTQAPVQKSIKQEEITPLTDADRADILIKLIDKLTQCTSVERLAEVFKAGWHQLKLIEASQEDFDHFMSEKDACKLKLSPPVKTDMDAINEFYKEYDGKDVA